MRRNSILMTVLIAFFAIAVYAYAATPTPQRSNQTQAASFSYAQLTISGEEVTWDPGGNNVPRTRKLEAAYRELGGGQRASLVNLLNAIGENGWELVDTDGTIWVFKRG